MTDIFTFCFFKLLFATLDVAGSPLYLTPDELDGFEHKNVWSQHVHTQV